MTLDQINARPAAAVSSTPDTDIICEWLKEIASQSARTNELLSELIKHKNDSLVLRKIYGIVTRQLAEPGPDTGTLIEIATLIEPVGDPEEARSR